MHNLVRDTGAQVFHDLLQRRRQIGAAVVFLQDDPAIPPHRGLDGFLQERHRADPAAPRLRDIQAAVLRDPRNRVRAFVGFLSAVGRVNAHAHLGQGLAGDLVYLDGFQQVTGPEAVLDVVEEFAFKLLPLQAGTRGPGDYRVDEGRGEVRDIVDGPQPRDDRAV